MPTKRVAAKKPESSAAANVWAFVGTDDLRVKEKALAKVREVTPAEAGEFGIETIDGVADHTDHAIRIVRNTIEALQTLPFFGGEKVVWLKSVNFLADTVTGRSAGTMEALEELMSAIQSVPRDVKLVLSASDVDKRRKFYLDLKKSAILEVHDTIDTKSPGGEEQLARHIEARANEHGLDFDEDALELFTMLAGEDTRQIDNELEKLDLYLGETRRVRIEDVKSIVSHTKKGAVFELGNAIGQRQLPYALAVLDRLMEQGDEPMAILLAAIVPKVRNLFAARQIEERFGVKASGPYPSYAGALERLPERERSRLPQKKDGTGLNVYPMYLAAKEAGKYETSELFNALEACLAANRRLVTSGLDPMIVLSQAVVRIVTGKS